MCNDCPRQGMRGAFVERPERHSHKRRRKTVMDSKFCVSTIFLLNELRHDKANVVSAIVVSMSCATNVTLKISTA
jgi:hypothetical protein